MRKDSLLCICLVFIISCLFLPGSAQCGSNGEEVTSQIFTKNGFGGEAIDKESTRITADPEQYAATSDFEAEKGSWSENGFGGEAIDQASIMIASNPEERTVTPEPIDTPHVVSQREVFMAKGQH